MRLLGAHTTGDCLRHAVKVDVKPNMTASVHFNPTNAHCVLPRWSPAAPSRNLAL